MARQFLNITYPSPEHPDYKKVIELVKNTNTYKSEVGRRLVHRGLEHLGNPHPLFGDPEAGSSVEPTVREEEQKVSAVNNTVNKGTVEHVRGEQTGQHLSGDKLMTRDKADPSSGSTPALDKKKSPEEDKSNAGWIILGVIGAGIGAWLIRKWTTKVDQAGEPNQIS